MRGWRETFIVSQVDGATLTSAAAASMIPAAAKFTIPANFFQIGRQLVIRAHGRISSVITTPGTARFDIRFGATVVFDSLAILLDTVAAHTNMPWDLEIRLTCRNIGTAATLHAIGKWESEAILGTPASSPKGAIVAMLPWNAAPAVGASFDSTAAQVVDAFFTQTVGTGSLICHEFDIECPNSTP